MKTYSINHSQDIQNTVGGFFVDHKIDKDEDYLHWKKLHQSCQGIKQSGTGETSIFYDAGISHFEEVARFLLSRFF